MGVLVLYIADMLAAEFDAAQISKNDVIRKTGIDRSTFYQILGNRRMATPVQFLKILNVLQPDTADRARLLRQYERERVGEEKFAKYEKVRAFLRRLSEADDTVEKTGSTDGSENAAGAENAAGTENAAGAEYTDGSENAAGTETTDGTEKTDGADKMGRAVVCPEPIASLIRHAVQKEGRIRLRLLLPTELFFSLGIESVLEENTRSGRTVYVEQLLSDWDGSSDADSMIMGFADYLKLLKRNTDFTVNAWMTDEVLFHPEGTPFPFYILADDAMVMFDHTGKKCIRIQDAVQIREFTEHFDRLLQHARPVVKMNLDMTEMFAYMTEVMRESEGKMYLFSDTPCIWLSTTLDLDRKYIDYEDALAYGELMRSLDVVEFTSKERIRRLFARRRISESGVDIEMRKEDIPVLHASVRDRIGRNLFLINEEVQPLPEGYIIFVAAGGKMIIAPFRDSRLQVYVENWDFAGNLYDWFATRISTVNPES